MKTIIPKRRALTIAVFVVTITGLVVLALNKMWVEKYYTSGVYRFISLVQRLISGKIPFSIGDVLYILTFFWILYKIIRNIYLLFVRKLSLKIILRKLSKLTLIIAGLYMVFLMVWGLNYSREGIAWQLNLERPPYDSTDIFRLQEFLIEKVNASKERLLTSQVAYPDNHEIFRRAALAYQDAGASFPFLKYNIPSIKTSMLGLPGNYMGFTGYYNPLTGEAQVNTTVPRFLLPAITVHEIAHQLGYAKENAANFVGFLVGTHCEDPLFQYSAWFDLFLYANAQVRTVDSVSAAYGLAQLNENVLGDIDTLRRFNERYESFAGPLTSWIYGKYLEFNKQPLGIRSYNAVISLVIAYYKKQGVL